MKKLLAFLTDPRLHTRIVFLMSYGGVLWAALQAAASLSGGAVWSAPAVIALLQLVSGKVQKQIPNEIWENRVIPIANYFVGLWGYSLAPVPLHAAVGSLAAVPALLFNPFVMAFVSTLCTSGLHTAFKNTLQLLTGRQAGAT